MRTRNFADAIRRKLARDPDLALRVETESINAHIAVALYDARTAKKLTQTQLAELIGTHQTVIARLENADYEGHSLSMLRRIADALDCNLRIDLFPRCQYGIAHFEETIVQAEVESWDPRIDLTVCELHSS
jgi:transcriptional regulator with XRE-family HTH domain